MKRKGQHILGGAAFDDVKLNLTTQQLAGIGAVAMAYNEAEIRLEFILYTAIGLPGQIWREVTSRIQGADEKVLLIKVAAKAHLNAPAQFAALMEDTLAGFSECKGYRDGVIHTRVLDSKTAVGQNLAGKGKISQVLLTTAALDGIYNRLVILREELEIIDTTFNFLRQSGLAITSNWRDPNTIEYIPEIDDWLARLLNARERRKALPALPTLPLPASAQAVQNKPKKSRR
jgi:hypothetical protein